MHTGPAVERSGDWFGAAVNLAARVSGLAAGGEVLLTKTTKDLAGQLDGVRFENRGHNRLRNVAEPVAVFAALPDAGAAREPLIDPVCRMAIDPARAAGTLTHEGSEYHFCSLDCVARFATSPDAYT
jgi:adenylate cyclase